jgi:glycosyltransferase involved in cell wall biosynthesis
MAEETKKYTLKDVLVTPFGVDLNLFNSYVKENSEEKKIVIGTIKALEIKYGIEYLIKAYHIVKIKYPEKELKLLIVGEGNKKEDYEKLVIELGLQNDVEFTGKISFDKVPFYHNMIDIFVSVSVLDSESFGVAIVESSATEKPVVVSNVGGLPEVVEDGVTGFVVAPKDAVATANAIEKLIFDKKLRQLMGKAGRKRVESLYNWERNVEQMVEIYYKILVK